MGKKWLRTGASLVALGAAAAAALHCGKRAFRSLKGSPDESDFRNTERGKNAKKVFVLAFYGKAPMIDVDKKT